MQLYADPDALIDDPRVLALPMGDSHEPFVDVGKLHTLAIDATRSSVQRMSDDVFHVRAAVADRLVRAQEQLLAGYQLQLKEGWRPAWVQQRLWQINLERLRGRRPDLADDELHRENARLVAPPDLAPPHSTGGAVDVVLLHQGSYADMGAEFNEPGPASRTDCPVREAARRHRETLASAMDAAGFINYPQEWWHWSYGDRYWAFQTTQQAALYGPR